MTARKVVVTTLKNEAPYFLEWVAYHQLIGFDHILVYTNDCADGTNRILRRLEALGHLTFRPNRVGPGGVHRSALRQARRTDLVRDADWVYVADIDEFLNIHVGDHSVDALIEATGPDVDAIAVPWKIFSSNGKAILRSNPVIEQFTDAEISPVDGGATRRFVKTLFRPNPAIVRLGLHGPVLRDGEKDAMLWSVPGGARQSRDGMGGHVAPPFGSEIAQVNHYAVRSAEAYLVKRHRGRANHMGDVLDTDYWDRWNRGGEDDQTILRHLPALKERIAAFREDPRLRRLHNEGFRWHKALVEELREDTNFQALFDKIRESKTRIPARSERPRFPARAAEPARENLAEKPPGLPPIGSLWIGQELSFVEQACLLSFVRHGHSVTLFTYGSVANVPLDIAMVDAREIHDTDRFLYSKFGTPVVQSDVFRLKLIRQTDMVWADADMLCLRPLDGVGDHVHGYFAGRSICNALLRLPKDSPAFAAYEAYVADAFPVPPWLDGAKRSEAEALKAKGAWKHASEQAHDIFGPPALTHFLRESGEIAESKSRDWFYPVAFRDTECLIDPKNPAAAMLTDESRTVHLWGRRLRWLLPKRGLKPRSFIYNALKDLEINPQIAELPKEQVTTIWDGARLLPRRTEADAICEAVDLAPSPRRRRIIASRDPAIRLAERIYENLLAEDRYGLSLPAPAGHRRGIDHYDAKAGQIFALANSLTRYAEKHGRLPRVENPQSVVEKLLVWKHFGALPIPSPADKLAVEAYVPEKERALLRIPKRPWISAEDAHLPGDDEIPHGPYFAKANHSHGGMRLSYPLKPEARAFVEHNLASALRRRHGFWGFEWWYDTIDRKIYLEEHLNSKAPLGDVADWKFWVIAGRVRLVQVDLARSQNHIQLLYTRDFVRLNEELYFDSADIDVPMPARYGDMLAVAEAVGTKIEFARVDLYDTPKGLVLGEITLCPNGARFKIRSESLARRLGDAWQGTALFPGQTAAAAPSLAAL
ncbi:MAG: ATP-grasp fold amidoligase family protein [Pseudomonadota bacterium]